MQINARIEGDLHIIRDDLMVRTLIGEVIAESLNCAYSVNADVLDRQKTSAAMPHDRPAKPSSRVRLYVEMSIEPQV